MLDTILRAFTRKPKQPPVAEIFAEQSYIDGEHHPIPPVVAVQDYGARLAYESPSRAFQIWAFDDGSMAVVDDDDTTVLEWDK